MNSKEFNEAMQILAGDYPHHFKEMLLPAKLRWKEKFIKEDAILFKKAIGKYLDDKSVNKYPPKAVDIEIKLKGIRPFREAVKKDELILTDEERRNNLKKLSEIRKFIKEFRFKPDT